MDGELGTMPSSVLSHQGIVLPLKIKYPEKFDGTALCVGSFAPDLAFLIYPFLQDRIPLYRLFHSIEGLLYTIPLSLLLVIFFNRVLLPKAASLASRKDLGLLAHSLTFFGVDDFYVLRRKKLGRKWFVKAFYSVLLGVLSHFLLDLPTHGKIPYLSPFYYGLMPEWFLYEHMRLNLPLYGTFEVTNYDLLWGSFSIGFGILALYSMRHIKKQRLLQKWYPKTSSQ